MVVHVVAAEIGKGRSRKLDAVEPALVEAVAGSLHRRMGDAGICEFGKKLVQGNRIGRGERTVVVAAGRHHACRADHRGSKARMRPDLPGEGGDRGLAGRARHRNHRLRLATVERGGGAREKGARVAERKNGCGGSIRLDAGFSDDGNGAARKRVDDIAGAVCLGAGDGDEKISWLHMPAVGRNAGNLDLRGSAIQLRRKFREARSRQVFYLHEPHVSHRSQFAGIANRPHSHFMPNKTQAWQNHLLRTSVRRREAVRSG